MNVAAIATALLLLPSIAMAHGKGMYPSEAEALQRAKQLGCSGAHRNGDAWMPCRDEAALHRALREK